MLCLTDSFLIFTQLQPPASSFLISNASLVRLFPILTCPQTVNLKQTNQTHQEPPSTPQPHPLAPKKSDYSAPATACSSTPAPASSPATAPLASSRTVLTAPCHRSLTYRVTSSPSDNIPSRPKTSSTSSRNASTHSAWLDLERGGPFRGSVWRVR